jgi:PiT family inorganic phosphate transporter
MTLLIIIIVLALIFYNGFHDAANAIATVVATKVLTPFQAVLWAAFFNSCLLGFGFGVADTVAKNCNTMKSRLLLYYGIMHFLCWNLLTWWLGIPSVHLIL